MGIESLVKRRFFRCAALLSLSLVSACGGSSSGGPVSTPTPAPAPAPAPTPTPIPPTGTAMPPGDAVPTVFNTTEFRRSSGPLEHNAASAWNLGRTGQGVTIAVFDNGIDEDSPEFAGRISPLSRDMTGANRSLTGPDDHGTTVAMVAAAARNNVGILGMAYDSTIMALRGDSVGSCAGGSSPGADSECTFSDSTIAAAITYASTNGAKVINISLGGEGVNTAVQSAVAAAVDRGTLIVVAAGNDEAEQPNSFARLVDQAGNGGVIIVGSVDADGSLSSFSNRAGSQNNHFMTALGSNICCAYENGQLYVDNEGYIYLFSGTSFSAPQVSGAAALLAQAFPNLTGRQIADILLRSAFDAGSPGTDVIYGRGILNVASAFQPIGTTALAGGTTALPLGDAAGAGSGPMGDAFASASLPSIVLDQYRRAFETDLAGTLRGAQPTGRLSRAVWTSQRNVSIGFDRTAVAFAIDDRGRLSQLRLGKVEARRARVLAARIATQLAPDLRVGFAYAEDARGLVAQLQGQDKAAFLLTAGADDHGMFQRSGLSIAINKQAGPWSVTASAERGETVSAAAAQPRAMMGSKRFEGEVGTFGLALDRRFGALEMALDLTWMAEQDTLLGARFHEAFGLQGANSLFAEARAGWALTPHWRWGATFRQGRTIPRDGGRVAAGSSLVSRAWSLDLERRGVFTGSDRLGVRVSQPLRVESGRLNLSLPAGYSYETLQANFEVRSLALDPQGRELLGEIAWSGPVLTGKGAFSLFYRRDPSHYKSLSDDEGVALRWTKQF